jgi:hypothetical protein
MFSFTDLERVRTWRHHAADFGNRMLTLMPGSLGSTAISYTASLLQGPLAQN